MQPKRFALFSAFTLAILLVSLVSPAIARADEATPPPAEPSTEVAPVDETPADPVSADDDESAPEETDAAPTEETAPTEAAPDEPAPDVEEVLASLPEETAIVALDAEGQALPLASLEAAQVIVSGDPMWCPAGVLPGGAGCAGYPSFAALIAELTDLADTGNDGLPSDAGTIYIESNYNATTAGDAGSDIVFDYGDIALTDLVVQGGWNGLFGASAAIVGTSTIDLGANNTLDFWDWGAFGYPASLTLRDLVIASGGLYIADIDGTTTANVTLENVTVTNAEENAYIQTTGSVTATNSAFDDNLDDGLVVIADGNITLNNVSASGNAGIGADLDTLGALSITNGDFSDNDSTGLLVLSDGNITLNNVNADENGSSGADLTNCGCLAGNISITNSTFDANAEGGLGAFTDGDVTLSTTTASGNGATGIFIDNGGVVSLSQIVASGNTDDGISVGAGGNITLTGVTGNGNGGLGALLEICGCGAGNINIFSGEFNVNDEVGLVALSGGNVTISDTDTFGNSGPGIVVESGGNVALTGLNSGYNGDIGVGVGATGNVSVTNSWIGFNVGTGFGTETNGNVTLANSAFFDNADAGAFVTSNGSVDVSNSFFGNCFFGSQMCEDQQVGLIVLSTGPVDISNSQLNLNTSTGLIVMSDSDVFLNNVSADGNGFVGAVVNTLGNVKVCGGSYSYNDRFGFTATAPTVFMSEQTLITGNGDLPMDLGPGTTVITYDCSPKKTGDYKMVNVSDGQSVEIACEEGQAGIELHLPNGDSLIVPCPMRGPAGLSGLAFDQLPAGLPDGFLLVSALEAQAARDGLTVSFMMPSPDVEYTILRWNGASWVELDGVTTVDGMFAVVSVTPGFYVLAMK